MNIETFRIFCDVAHYQSFSRGAEANNVSQSAATQSIRRLESQLGVTLIDRAKRPFLLTNEGRVCYEGFREILESYDAVVARVHSLRNEGGAIRVAAIYSVGLHDMSKCMQDFIKECPKSKIRLEFLHPAKVYHAVLNSETDFGVVSYPSTSPEIDVIPLRSEEMALVTPPNSPLAGRKEVSLDEVQNLDFVAFDRELPIRKEIDRWFRQRGVRVNVVMEFDNIETIKQAIEVGVGASILPTPTVRAEIDGGKMAVTKLESLNLTRPIGVIFRRRKALSPAAARFIEMLGGDVAKHFGN
ncbi:MAG: LysR family transcriptional regulator [Thermoguttaceae bacterium]|nr:LysR family transcriptional regulator [Thermoguttaceae bacterium]